MFTDMRETTLQRNNMKMQAGRYVTMKPKTPTVAASFHESLTSLIDNMSKWADLVILVLWIIM